MMSSGSGKTGDGAPKEDPSGTDDTHIVFRAEDRDQQTKLFVGGAASAAPASPEVAGAVVGVAKKQHATRAAASDATVFVPGRGVKAPLKTESPVPTPSTGGAGDSTVFLPSMAAKTGAAQSGDTMASAFDPVAGWLVVLDGPGKGNFRAIYYGQNSIGRGSEQRVSLDFGDQSISRDTHAFIVYDDIDRKFYVRDNHKPNLVRLAGRPVMSPMELQDRQEITIGDTKLLFVALCGRAFDWFAGHEPTKS